MRSLQKWDCVKKRLLRRWELVKMRYCYGKRVMITNYCQLDVIRNMKKCVAEIKIQMTNNMQKLNDDKIIFAFVQQRGLNVNIDNTQVEVG